MGQAKVGLYHFRTNYPPYACSRIEPIMGPGPPGAEMKLRKTLFGWMGLVLSDCLEIGTGR